MVKYGFNTLLNHVLVESTSELGAAGVADRHGLTGVEGGLVLGLGDTVGAVGRLASRVLPMLRGASAETLLRLVVTTLFGVEAKPKKTWGHELYTTQTTGPLAHTRTKAQPLEATAVAKLFPSSGNSGESFIDHLILNE